jgi:hypothetical protein
MRSQLGMVDVQGLIQWRQHGWPNALKAIARVDSLNAQVNSV